MSSSRKNIHVGYGQNKLTVLVLIQEDAECPQTRSRKHIKLYKTWDCRSRHHDFQLTTLHSKVELEHGRALHCPGQTGQLPQGRKLQCQKRVANHT